MIGVAAANVVVAGADVTTETWICRMVGDVCPGYWEAFVVWDCRVSPTWPVCPRCRHEEERSAVDRDAFRVDDTRFSLSIAAAFDSSCGVFPLECVDVSIPLVRHVPFNSPGDQSYWDRAVWRRDPSIEGTGSGDIDLIADVARQVEGEAGERIRLEGRS